MQRRLSQFCDDDQDVDDDDDDDDTTMMIAITILGNLELNIGTAHITVTREYTQRV